MSDALVPEIDLEKETYFYNQGTHTKAYHFLGAVRLDEGFKFTVWAPNAYQVEIQGDFNDWALTSMEKIPGGMWTVDIKNAKHGDHYKYAIDNGRGYKEYKIDPFAYRFEEAPKDASIVWELPDKKWTDRRWLQRRRRTNHFESPMNIYEVHPSSWKQHEDGSLYNLSELADELIPYAKKMGYTHIELMPLMDHPLDASWGYQITGYYAVSARYGTPEDLHYFVDKAHNAGLGVFMDWVPGHFNRNQNALAFYDGTPTYEFADYNRANNIGWGTLNFDLGKNQVQSFLISNALFWIREFHIDGLRVDAVSNILYLDFDEGPWTPNEDGTNLSKEGIQFLKNLNNRVHKEFPDAIMMAEESTDWPKITHPIEDGGLGFDYKWNMGWMNDTLKFFEMVPLYRPENLRLVTFVFMYQYNERYILPYSHDEVVHGKNSMLGKIPGDRYQQFATLRTIFGYMLAQPGKNLSFMGNEIGQFLEWRYYSGLEWGDLDQPYNSEYQHFIETINNFAINDKSFYQLDHSPEGFTGLEADDLEEGKLSFIRRGKAPRDFTIIMCNFVPVERQQVRVGVPYKGTYEIVLNSEMKEFGGNWETAQTIFKAEEIPANDQPYSIEIIVPSLSVQYIKPKRVYGVNKK